MNVEVILLDTQTPSRTLSFMVCAVAYLFAVGIALVAAYIFRTYPLLYVIGIADLVATAVIFAWSYAYNNTSLYDAYWSVIPIVITIALLITSWPLQGPLLRALLVSGCILWWGVRLTYNWARGWGGLAHQDWRYVNLQKSTGPFYWIVSLLGLHLFPTVLVFLGMLSVYTAIYKGTRPMNLLDLLALTVTVGAILVETIADKQLHTFVRNRKDPLAILDRGLWGQSRHPNYFGECTFWWGMCLFSLAAAPKEYIVLVGPIAMTCLFYFVSIPMIDKRMLKKRPHYEQLMKEIPAMFPHPPGFRK